MKCNGIVFMQGVQSWPCQNGATIQRGTEWFCWGHDPEGEEKRLKAARKRKMLPHWRTGKPQGSK